MATVLDRLTAPKAPIDLVRKHGVEEFHGTSLDEVKCPPEQMIKCAISLTQSVAYDWWKLDLRNPLLLDPIT